MLSIECGVVWMREERKSGGPFIMVERTSALARIVPNARKGFVVFQAPWFRSSR